MKPMLHEILRVLEFKLDTEHVNQVKNRHQKTLDYEKVDRPPVKIILPASGPKPCPYAEAFHDYGKMMFNELVAAKFTTSIFDGTDLHDDTLPMIRANFGVAILPSLFGVEYRLSGNDLPWVTPLREPSEIERLIARGIPMLTAGLGGKVFEAYEYYLEQLEKYPVCRECIAFCHPDLQGPFDIAHLIWGTEIYYALYDSPELVHRLLELVTETYIRYLEALKRLIRDSTGRYLFHWGSLFKGGMVLRNDTAVNLSREMYEIFVRPYDEKIFRAFEGGSIHFCGRGDQWISSMLQCQGLQALNNGQPPNMKFGIEYLRSIYKEAAPRRIPLVDYILDAASFREGVPSEFQTGVSFKVFATDPAHARQILDSLSKNNQVNTSTYHEKGE